MDETNQTEPITDFREWIETRMRGRIDHAGDQHPYNRVMDLTALHIPSHIARRFSLLEQRLEALEQELANLRMHLTDQELDDDTD